MLQSKKQISSNLLIYLVCFFIISFTFQNFFHSNSFKLVIVLLGVITYFRYIGKLEANAFFVMLLVSIIIAVQGVLFGYNLVSHFTSMFFNVFLIYVLLKILPFNYHEYMIKIIYFLSVISMILWLACNFSPAIHQSIPEISERLGLDRVNEGSGISGGHEQILVFTYEKAMIFGIIRNAGFCHEPGGYAVILIYALVFNTLLTKKFFSKKNMFFIVCLLTTFSTAGYAALYIILLNNYLAKRRHIVGRAIGIILAVLISIYSFSTLDFMSSKISDQYNAQAMADLNEETDGRIMGARKALVVLSRYPFTGRGFLTVSQTGNLTSEEAAGYGFMTFASQVGIPLTIFAFVLFFRTLHFWSQRVGFKKKNALLFFLCFLPVLFSQTFIPSLLFNMIIFESLFRNYKGIKWSNKIEIPTNTTPTYA